MEYTFYHRIWTANNIHNTYCALDNIFLLYILARYVVWALIDFCTPFVVKYYIIVFVDDEIFVFVFWVRIGTSSSQTVIAAGPAVRTR